jgi:hypothetical protein
MNNHPFAPVRAHVLSAAPLIAVFLAMSAAPVRAQR